MSAGLSLAGKSTVAAAATGKKHKVAYHVSDRNKVGFVLRNARNHIKGVGESRRIALTALSPNSVSKAIRRLSPTAMKVTQVAIRKAYKMAFNDALEMEYRLSMRFMEGHDFFEGVRAVLIDRDGTPSWRPAALEEVTEAEVDAYFAPLPSERELGLGSDPN